MIKINKELNARVFWLFVGGLVSGVFIKAIDESIKNSTPIMKFWWLLIVPIFALVDFITWIKTGEEIIMWILEQFGIELE